MKIDKNKPLPDHTKLKYDECCAKLILEELFLDRYKNLLLADKPDLQGINVGIEVTTADDHNKQESMSNLVKAYNCQDEKARNNKIERLAQLGVKYTGGVQSWPGFIPSFDLTKKAVESKIVKLKNGNYKHFERYELFIFTDTWYHENIVDAARIYLFGDSVNENYKTVYVLSQDFDLHIFETDTESYQNIKIDTSEQTDRNIRARQMVENAEDNVRS